jgi:hypothetical protein
VRHDTTRIKWRGTLAHLVHDDCSEERSNTRSGDVLCDKNANENEDDNQFRLSKGAEGEVRPVDTFEEAAHIRVS